MTRGGDGLPVACTEWPGTGAPVLAVHATGFCKETWSPMVAELRDAGAENAVVAMDQRGHGDSPAPEPPYDWWDLGRDALVTARSIGSDGMVGIGHSSGAAALVMAEVLGPGTFRALVLVEPIMFPGPFRRAEDNPMSAAALKRRAAFPSAAAALDNFRGKGPFAGWDDRALHSYVACGLAERDGAWHLKCRPDVEAEYYRGASAHGAWDRLGEVAPPAVLVAGEASDTHPEPFLTATAQRFPKASSVIVGGASHFVPMERPDVVAGLLAEVLRGGMPAGRR